MHALIVDDSKSARFFLKNLLRTLGLEVHLAESAEEGLEYLWQNRPDVVFMDHLMPGMDGFAATQAIKGNPSTAQVPVIMCTSNEGEEYQRQALAIGASGILSKPASEEKVKALLAAVEAAQAQVAAGGAAAPSAEDLQVLAEAAVRTVLRERVPQPIKQLIEQQVQNLREELLQTVSSASRDAAEELLRQQKGLFQAEIMATTEALNNEALESIRATAKSDVTELAGNLRKQTEESVFQKLSALRIEFEQDKDQVLASAREIAGKTAEASVTTITQKVESSAFKVAREIAEVAAKDTAAEVAKSAGSDAAGRVSGALEKKIAQVRSLALGAGAVGVIAALAVYFLK